MVVIERSTGQRMNIATTTAKPQDGIDLKAYLASHSGDILAMLLIATLITMGHWRDWFYPDNLLGADGKTPDPRAGKLILKKAIAEFLFIPTILIVGLLVLGFTPSLAIAAAVVAFIAFVGSAFIMTLAEKARDGALGIGLDFLRKLLGGKPE